LYAREGKQQNASKYLLFLWECQQYVSHPKGHPDHQPWGFVHEAIEADRQAADHDLPTSGIVKSGLRNGCGAEPQQRAAYPKGRCCRRDVERRDDRMQWLRQPR
jgi:hypothetical protein